jgi:hypothetical protein
MEPSWTSPIPQVMQQHRGSQLQKPKPAEPSDAAQHAEPLTPAVGAQPGDAGRVQKRR